MAERSLEVTFLAAVKAGVLDILGLFDTAHWFKAGADWAAWRAFLAAVYGLPMSDHEYDIFRICTGRKDPPKRKVREAWLGVGRRGRKSAIMATIGVYEAAFCYHDNYLAPGEYVRVPVMSKNKDDAAQIRRYAGELLNDPTLAWLLEGEPTTELIRLRTRAEISIRTASIMGGRTFATRAALLDEQAFWPTDTAAEPDVEVLRGIRPSMANVPGALIVGASSLYARRGLLYAAMRDYWGVDGQNEVLAWKATTLMMHNTEAIREYVDLAWKQDPVAALAEVGRPEQSAGIEFRSDVETYVPLEIIRACTESRVTERAPMRGVRYAAFVDPSGGSSDSFTLAIGHYDQRLGVAVLDLVREERSPLDAAEGRGPDDIARQFCHDLRTYGVRTVYGDHYAGDWPAAAFRDGAHDGRCPRVRDRRGNCECEPWSVTYVPADDDASTIYLQFLPALRSRRVLLLDDVVLSDQLQKLQRKPRATGDLVTHPPGDHDDVANAVAGVLVMVLAARVGADEYPPPAPPKTVVELHRQRLMGAVQKRIKETVRGRRSGPGGLY